MAFVELWLLIRVLVVVMLVVAAVDWMATRADARRPVDAQLAAERPEIFRRTVPTNPPDGASGSDDLSV